MAEVVTERPQSQSRGPFSGLSRNVVLLGVTSFFADVSGEMIYPLVPIFLTGTLGAPVAVVGLIEGIAESTASLVKLASGWISDRVGRRMPLVISGYGFAAIGKLILALATIWPVVLFARFVDRFGKGVRGSPRDALIADSTLPELRGRAFGLHRSLDTAGAVIGPLLGLALVALLDDRLRLVFLIAAMPGFISVLCLTMVKDPTPAERAPSSSTPGLVPALRGIDARLKLFLVASLVFALGNSSDIFLILRAKDLGMSTTAVVLAYVVYNFVFMSVAFPAGILSDRLGRKNIFVFGLVIFAAVYAGFAVANDPVYLWPLFAVYGLYIATTDGVSKALITDLAPRERRASALGAYGMLTGLATLLASVVAGVLWDTVGASAPFIMGAAAAILSAVLLVLVIPARQEPR